MSHLRNLRKKPKHVRDNIAFVAAGIITLPVMAYMLLAVHGPRVTSSIAETDTKEMKFFETFTTQIKEQVASVRAATSSSTPEKPKTPAVIDRGPLDAVPVESPATTSANSRFNAAVNASSSIPQDYIAPATDR